MTFTPIPQGTLNWDIPVNSSFEALQDQVDGLFSSSGGTLNGNVLIIGPDGTPTMPSLGRYSLKLQSSFNGGENTFDSTGRVELESYQRAQLTNGTAYAHYGEVMRIRSRKHNSKQMIAWYGPTSYDLNGDPVGNDTAWFWMGAHYDPNDPGPVHGHWSVEAPDSAQELQTRFEIRIWDPTTGAFGMDRTIAKFNAADVIVAQDNGAMHMAAAAGTAKNLYFTNDTTVVSGVTATGRRWTLQADNTAESGSNVGTDFRIGRYNDSGAFVDTALFVERSTGRIGVGNITSPTAKMDVLAAGSYHTVQATQTTSGAVNFAAYSGILGLSTNKLFDGRVSGDSVGRLAIYGTGMMEWGNGTAGRDVNLYRSATDILKTDDSLNVATRMTIGNAALQTNQLHSESDGTRVAGFFKATADGTTSLGVLSGEAFSSAKRLMDLRVTGDTLSRFRVDMSLGSGSGTITFGNGTLADTNLYRSAADTLSTDDNLTVALNLTATGNLLMSGTNIQTLTGTATTTDKVGTLVSGDTFDRFRLQANGQLNWGSGSGARDTNLYRNAADQLKTDDKLITVIGLGVGNSATATAVGTLTRKMEVFDATGASLGFVPIYATIT